MTGQRQIAQLTLHWALFGTAMGLFNWIVGGLGILNLVFSAIGIAIGLAITFAIGRALNNKNHFVRWLVIGVSSLSVLASVGAVWSMFFGDTPFALLHIAYLAASVAMNVHSLRVLFSDRVQLYFR